MICEALEPSLTGELLCGFEVETGSSRSEETKIRARSGEYTCHRIVVIDYREHGRRQAVFCCHVQVGPRLDQDTHGTEVTMTCSKHESGLTEPITCVNVCTPRELRGERGCLALLGGFFPGCVQRLAV